MTKNVSFFPHASRLTKNIYSIKEYHHTDSIKINRPHGSPKWQKFKPKVPG